MANKPAIGQPADLLQTPFVTIRRYPAQFEGFAKNYDVVVFGPRAGVVVLREDRVLMTKQYRFLPNADGWEIPGGTVSEDESPEAAARRECLEETGVECQRLVPLGLYYPGLDNVDNRTSLFVCAESCDAKAFRSDPAEVTAITWLPIADVLQSILRGEIQDAFTQIAIMSYVCRVFEERASGLDFAAYAAGLLRKTLESH